MATSELETTHNYPKGSGKEPICPHSELVQICNALAGNEVTPETFCTVKLTNPVWIEGQFTQLISGTYLPMASCAVSNMMLTLQLSFINGQLSSETIANLTKRQKNRNKIMARWRKVIFDTCCLAPDGEENGIKSPDDLTESYVIEKVTEFAQELQEIHGYEPNYFNWWDGSAQNCEQSPRKSEVGPLID
jgi:hypothetical protein